MADYLSKLESLKDKVQKGKTFTESLLGKENYRKVVGSSRGRYKEIHNKGFDLDNYSKKVLKNYEFGERNPESESEKRDALFLGSRLFQVSAETKNPRMALDAVEMYELLGKANRKSVKNRFIKILQSSERIPSDVYDKAEDYFKKWEGEDKSKGGLEGKIATGIFGLLFLAGLFFSSSNLTGNAIGVSQDNMNFIGIGLMLLGVVGFFVYRKFR